MKAVILAGGSGTRGKPFTDYFPKAMIPVEGKPLIHHIVDYLSSFDFIDEIAILGDFIGFGSQTKRYFENRTTRKRVSFIQDSHSGTAGDLLHLGNFIKKDSEFILWFSDNLGAIDLPKMYRFYKEKNSLACIATRSYRREETGYAVTKDGWLTEFKEKPFIQLPMAECLGIYILETKILRTIKTKKTKQKQIDLSFDVLEEIADKRTTSAFDIGKTLWIDIESPAKAERNKRLVKEIVKKMKT